MMTKFKKFFDLSQPVYSKCPGWPTYELTDVVYEATHEKDGFAAEQIKFNAHTGTHLDAPYHFYSNGKTVDQIPVEVFQGEAVLVDLRDVIHAKESIEPKHLEKYSDLIKEGCIVLINTGWGKKRSFDEEYYHNWPYLSKECAEWLKGKKVKGIGIDCMSMGGWYEGTGRPCHEVLLSEGIWLLEELNFPDELMEQKTCYLMAFPLKLQGFSGAPARAVAAIE